MPTTGFTGLLQKMKVEYNQSRGQYDRFHFVNKLHQPKNEISKDKALIDVKYVLHVHFEQIDEMKKITGHVAGQLVPLQVYTIIQKHFSYFKKHWIEPTIHLLN